MSTPTTPRPFPAKPTFGTQPIDQPRCCECSCELYFEMLRRNALFPAIVPAYIRAQEQPFSCYDLNIVGASPTVNHMLFVALESRQYNVLDALLDYPQLNIQATDNLGNTIIHLAVMRDDFLAAKILVRHKDLDINRLNSAGQSALTLPAKNYDGQQQQRNQILDLFVSYSNVIVV